jgi:hypothetical protein
MFCSESETVYLYPIIPFVDWQPPRALLLAVVQEVIMRVTVVTSTKAKINLFILW